MKAKGLLLTLVVIIGLLFAVLNWQLLFTSAPVNLLFATVEMPLGISLLLLAVGLSLLFFLASLWERANQLRQVTHQERLIDGLRARLDKQRAADLEALEGTVRERFDSVQQQIERDSGRVEANLRESLADMEMRQKERLDAVEDRVALVRDELAADIAELEDRLQREFVGRVESSAPEA